MEARGTPDGREQTVHESGRARVMENDPGGGGQNRGGESGIYGRGESGEALAHARSPIRRPLNPGGGATARLRLLNLMPFKGFKIGLRILNSCFIKLLRG
jgi:hypothetical protein